MKTNIVVTGSTGFIGKNLLEKLAERSKYCNITCIIRETSKTKYLKKYPVKIALWKDSPKFIRNADYILHLAAEIIHKDKTKYKNNIDMMSFLLSKVKNNRLKKLVFVSTYLAGIDGSDYGASKKFAEDILIRSNQDYIILRPSVVYGQHDTNNISALHNLIKKSPVIPLFNSKASVQPVFVDDLVKVLLMCIDKKIRNGIYYVAGSEMIDFKLLINKLCSIEKKKRLIIPIPSWLSYLLVYIYEKISANPKFTSEQLRYWGKTSFIPYDNVKDVFGVELTSLDKGLVQTFSL